MISVEKLKSTLDFFSAGNKLSKAFRLNVNHDVLRRSNEDRFSMGNPFADNHDYGKVSG